MAKNGFGLVAPGRFVRVLGKRVAVAALSIGLILAGCSYNPPVRQFGEIPSFVIRSEDFISASSELAEQGIAIGETLAAEEGAIVLGTSQPGVVMNILFSQGKVISVTIFKVIDSVLTVRNPSSDLATTVSLGELYRLEQAMVTHRLELSIVYGTHLHELARTLGFGIGLFEAPQGFLEAQCAACRAEQTAVTNTTFGLTAAIVGYATAVAGLASCGAIITKPLCVAALIAYPAAKAGLMSAIIGSESAQSSLDRCLRTRC